MGCRILEDTEENQACFYCSTSGVAFGPLFESHEEAEAFMEFLDADPRKFTVGDLVDKHAEFRKAWEFFAEGCATDADEAAIRKLALEAVEIRIHRDAQAHPFGSTTAVEQLVEPELLTDEITVEIPETVKTLPDEFSGNWPDDEGCNWRLLFKPAKGKSFPVVNTKERTVTYCVEID